MINTDELIEKHWYSRKKWKHTKEEHFKFWEHHFRIENPYRDLSIEFIISDTKFNIKYNN